MADNTVRFGVSNSRYALEKEDGTYDSWNRIPGTVQVQIEPQESQSDFYADNMVYFIQNGAASDQVTIEIADLTDQAKIDLVGYVRKADGAGLLLPVNAKRKSFAYGFQVQGDEKNLRVCIYGGKLNRPSNTYSTTTDSTEPSTMSIEGRFAGKTFLVEGEEEPFLYYVSVEGDSDYDTFWDAVPLAGDIPTEETGETGQTGQTGQNP